MQKKTKSLDISSRLLSVQAKTAVFDRFEEERKLNRDLIKNAKREKADLRARLDDYENRSRLIIFSFTIYLILRAKIGKRRRS